MCVVACNNECLFLSTFGVSELYSSPNIQMIIQRRINCARHVGQVGETQYNRNNLNGNQMGDLCTGTKIILTQVFKNDGVIICAIFKRLRTGVHKFSKNLLTMSKL